MTSQVAIAAVAAAAEAWAEGADAAPPEVRTYVEELARDLIVGATVSMNVEWLAGALFGAGLLTEFTEAHRNANPFAKYVIDSIGADGPMAYASLLIGRLAHMFVTGEMPL